MRQLLYSVLEPVLNFGILNSYSCNRFETSGKVKRIIAVERIVIEFKCAAHVNVCNNVIIFLFRHNDSKPHVRTYCI